MINIDKRWWFLAIGILIVALMFLAEARRTAGAQERGIASIYGNGDGFAGRKTANGETMDPRSLTAAHKTLPFNSVVTVVNEANGRSVRVRINNRGPFIRGRIIDVSPAAAKQLGFGGLTRVRIERGG